MKKPPPRVLRKAEFDPKLRVYMLASSSLLMLVTIVFIPLLPLWVPFAWFWWTRRHYESLHCELTDRSLVVKRGIWFKVEKTVPLEKIQDVSLRHGPLLDAFGLCSITIETAGQSGGGTGQGDAVLSGVVDARGFRDAVLEQREVASDRAAPEAAPPATPVEPSSSAEVLREIADTLRRIEERLERPADPPAAS